MEAYRIAVFASGSGSNFQAIVDEVNRGKLAVSVEMLICDRPDAYVITRAHAAGIPVFAVQPKSYRSKVAYEQAIVQVLQAKQVDLLVLAGYMRLITSVIIEAYRERIINVHPSLLPAFPGVKAVQQALDHGVKVTGVTVHIVDEGLDSGPILAQQALDVHPNDDEQTLLMRMQAVEHHLLPEVIGWFAGGKVHIIDRLVHIS